MSFGNVSSTVVYSPAYTNSVSGSLDYEIKTSTSSNKLYLSNFFVVSPDTSSLMPNQAIQDLANGKIIAIVQKNTDVQLNTSEYVTFYWRVYINGGNNDYEMNVSVDLSTAPYISIHTSTSNDTIDSFFNFLFGLVKTQLLSCNDSKIVSGTGFNQSVLPESIYQSVLRAILLKYINDTNITNNKTVATNIENYLGTYIGNTITATQISQWVAATTDMNIKKNLIKDIAGFLITMPTTTNDPLIKFRFNFTYQNVVGLLDGGSVVIDFIN